MDQLLGLDSTKAGQAPAGEQIKLDPASTFDPLSFYVGRVTRTFNAKNAHTVIHKDLKHCIDRAHSIVRSVTGELKLDYANGLAVMNAPCAQGATGFLSKAGKIELDDV